MEFHVISVVEFENIWALFNLESVKDLKELIAVKKRFLLIFRIVHCSGPFNVFLHYILGFSLKVCIKLCISKKTLEL